MSAGVEARVDRGLLGAGEAALALVTLSVVGGFSRLFRDNSYFGKMAALALFSHALALVVRRLGRNIVDDRGARPDRRTDSNAEPWVDHSSGPEERPLSQVHTA